MCASCSHVASITCLQKQARALPLHHRDGEMGYYSDKVRKAHHRGGKSHHRGGTVHHRAWKGHHRGGTVHHRGEKGPHRGGKGWLDKLGN